MLTGIRHGGDIYSRDIFLDFSVNVNPLGPPESVKEAVRQAAEYCGLYPDIQCRRLRAALAAHYQIDEEMIVCANGAADLIYQLIFALQPHYALLPAPTFSEYRQALNAFGCRVFSVPFTREEGFAIDVMKLIREAKKRIEQKTPPEILFLCNPNNPTGFVIGRKVMEVLAAFAEEEGIWLVVDECFMDFLEEENREEENKNSPFPENSLLPLLCRFPHMIIVKAFTKIYGMAGLRLGYGLSAAPRFMQNISSVRQPWSVSVPAQMAGIAALKESDYLLKTKTIVREGREQLCKGLSRLGFLVYPSRANYLFFRDLREGAEDGILYQHCLKEKLLLRSCADFEGLDKSYYRVGIKTKKENDCLLRVLADA